MALQFAGCARGRAHPDRGAHNKGRIIMTIATNAKLALSAVAFALAGPVAAAAVVDQAQLQFSTGIPFGYVSGSYVSNANIGQSYTAGIKGKLDSISMYCNGICSIDQLGNTLTLDLYKGGNLLSTATLNTTNGEADTTKPGYSILRFSFANAGIAQLVGQSYTFVLGTVTGPGDIKERGTMAFDGNAYLGGAALPDSFYGNTPGRDLMFKTEVMAGSVPEPASWALLIMGFGLTGAAMRRRVALAA
ncbi:MAG: hypothetical protein CFE37_09835 [Alphaproteobacteria bacterium PA4]|nr:MAG: hypothetical protein CFE37_09835 [Alphaproteobacteria bacterium PA4]